MLRHLAAAILCLPLLARSQSLEEKLMRSRALQMMESENQALIDSIMEERRGFQKPYQDKLSKRPEERGSETSAADSLLASPSAADSLFDSTAQELASLTSRHKGVSLKRYEHTIFKSVDRSVFANARGAVGKDHVLGPGDEVNLFMWGDKEKEYSLILNKEGNVFLEGVGLVLLAGLTIDQAKVKLKDRLGRIYSGLGRGTAHFDATLGKVGPIRVFVLGEVKVPGGYIFTGNTTVMSGIYFANGPTDIGTVRNLQLTRDGVKHTLDLYRYLIYGETMKPNVLLDGDILFAGRAEALVEIQGDVGRPAIYEVKKGEGIRELLQFCGGLNATAAYHKMSLQRIFPDGRLDYIDLAAPQDYVSGKEKIELLDGDRLLVERSAETSQNFITISGPVKYPGTYSATNITSVAQLVEKAGGLKEDAFLGRIHVLRFKPNGSSIMRAYSLDTLKTDSIQIMPKDYVVLYSVKEMYLPDSVEVAGAVFKPGRYEFRQGMTALDLVMQAGGYLPFYERGRILVFRGDLRERTVEQITIKIQDSLGKSNIDFNLKPYDFIQVPIDPKWYRKELVTLEGLFHNPGKYALLYPGEKLFSVVQRAGGLKEGAYIEGARFIRTKGEVGKVGVDIKQALNKPRSKSNISMVGGDSIFIPERLNTVKVIGEVGFETSVLFREGSPASYYIEKAGGFTRRSEKDRIVVQFANGETGVNSVYNRKPDAGSVIYVPQGPEPKPIEWFTGINALMGTMGVAAALILSIQAINNR